MGKCLSIDLGGSKLLVGIVDENGKVVDTKRKEYVRPQRQEDILEDFRALFNELKEHKPSICGMSLPGPVNVDSGCLILSPYNDVKNWRVTDDVAKITGLPVYAENDVNASAVGEKMFGKMQNVENFIWITLSNGVGGALYSKGKLYRGENFGAGEIGHFFVEENGEVCSCGNRGCLETVASGRGVSGFYKKQTGKDATAEEIGNFALQGDECANMAYNRLAVGLGRALSYAVNLLNIETFVFGGGVARSFSLFVNKMNDEMQKHLLHAVNSRTTYLYTGLGYNASLIGAAAVAFSSHKSDTGEK